MEDRTTIRVVVHLELDVPGLRGWVEDDVGGRLPFYGWLEFGAQLEDARTAAAGHRDSPQGPPRESD